MLEHCRTAHCVFLNDILRAGPCISVCACAKDNEGQYWQKKIIWGQADVGAGARPPLPSPRQVTHYWW